MKHIRIIARILLGLVFIFSGFVKGVDPMGSAIKFSDYFEAFHIHGLEQFTLVLAILLSTAEFIIGVALLIGLRMHITSWAVLLFMVIFTLLTLYSAIWNPVSDCGCFGDAIILTNWETFYKNIILLALALLVFKNRYNYIPYSSWIKEWFLISLYTTAMVWVSVYAVQHMPIIDFRPYHVGSHIPTKMERPEGAPADIYKTTYKYEKNGVIKEFDEYNLPAYDTTWKWVDTKSVLIKEGYKVPINNFVIMQADGLDITQEILTDHNYSFIFLSQNLTKITHKNWETIAKYKHYCDSAGAKFYIVTASPENVVNSITKQLKLDYSFYSTDFTAIKTINRANPGLMILKEGTVLAQQNVNDLPDPSKIRGSILSAYIAKYYQGHESTRVYVLILFLALSLALIWFLKPTQD